MSNVVDRKVVEMQFDNAQFEKNVRSSMSSIDKLKSSLNFDGWTKGFEEVDKSSSKLNFNGVSSALETVGAKFTWFEEIAVGALRRIGERAIDAGISLVKSMSVDQLATGWQKFADKTQSVGTLIAQGYDMEIVEDQLSKLNWYTDETSYEFTEMVANIAKFTAAGKDLPESVKSLMGIANWAALSGQNAQTASRAMYQLSQAMGAGVMRKEDYKSIQNVSMDTIEFRERALEAAVSLGTLKKNADGTYTSIVKGAKKSTFSVSQFADHLTQEAWFTSDVMMKVYGDYGAAIDKLYTKYEETGESASQIIEELTDELREELGPELADFAIKAFKAAQEARTWKDAVDSAKEAVASKWLQIYETIFGNYEEAKDLFTDLANKFYDAFVPPLDALNEKLQEGLRGVESYAGRFVEETFGIGEDLFEEYKKIGEGFGFVSDSSKDWLKANSKLDESNQNVLAHWMQLHSEATEAVVENTAMASNEFTKQAALVLGLSEEQVKALRAAGEENGYGLGSFTKELENVYGKGKFGLYETTAALLSVGKGLDQITAKDIDSYLISTIKLTEDQVKELHKLADEYGATSEQVDVYLRGQNNAESLGFANRGWTYKAVENLIALSSEIGNVTTAQRAYKKDDVVSYIQSLTGATKEEVETLWELVNATTESEEAAKKNQERIDEWVNTISKGDKELGNLILSLMDMEKQATKLSGRQNLIEAFNNAWEGLGATLETVKEAFLEVFPAPTAEQIYDYTVRLRDFTETLRLSDDQLDKVKRTFKGFFSIFKIIGQVAEGIYKPVKRLFDKITGSSGDILDLTANWGDWLTNLAETGEVGKQVEEIFDDVVSVIERAFPYLQSFVREFINLEDVVTTYETNGGGIAGVFAVIHDKIKSVLDLVIDLIAEFTGWDVSEVKKNVTQLFDNISSKIQNILPNQEKLVEGFTRIKEIAKKALNFLGFGVEDEDTKKLDSATSAIDNFSNTIEKVTPVFDNIKSGFKGVGDIFDSLFGTIKSWFDALSNSGAITGISHFFADLWSKIKEISVDDIVKLAGAGALIFVGWELGSFLKSAREIPDAISDLIGSFKRNDKFDGMKSFAIAVGILAASLYAVSRIDSNKLESSFWVITFLVGEMIGVMELMNHTLKGSGSAKGLGMLKFAASILIFAFTLEKIAAIDEKKLWSAVGVVSIITTVLAGAVAAFGGIGTKSGGKGELVGALSAIVFVLAIKGVAEVIADLAKADGDIQGAATVIEEIAIVITGCIAVLMRVSENRKSIDPKAIASFGGAMLMLGATIIEIAYAFTLIKDITDPGQLTAMALSLGGTLTALGLLAGIFSSIKTFDGKAALAFGGAMMMLGAALLEIAYSFSLLTSITDPLQMAAIALTLTIVVGALAGLLALITSSKTFDPGKVLAFAGAMDLLGVALVIVAASFVVFSSGLSIFADAIQKFSEMSNGDFWTGVLRIASATSILGVALAIMAPGAVVVLALSAALLVASAAFGIIAASTVTFGAGLGIVASNMILMAAAIGVLGLAMKTGGETFMDGLGIMLTGFIGLIPKISEAISEFGVSVAESLVGKLPRIRKNLATLVEFGIGVICDSIITSSAAITQTTLTVTLSILDALIQNGPTIAAKFMDLLISVLSVVASRAAEFVGVVMDIIIGVINGVSSRLPELISAVVELFVALLEGVVKAMESVGVTDIESILTAVLKLSEILLALGAIGLLVPFAMVGVLGLGLIAGELAAILAILGGLSKIPGVTSFIESGGELLGAIGTAIGSFLGGFVGGVLDGVARKLPNVGTNLSKFMKNAEGFISGANDIDGTLLENVGQLASAIIALSAADLIAGITSFLGIGMNFTDLGTKLELLGDAIHKWLDSTKDIDTAALSESVSAADKVVDLAIKVQKSESVFDYIIGKNTLGDFGGNLEAFAAGILTYAETAQNVVPFAPAMIAVADAIEPTVAISKDLHDNETILDYIFDHDALGDFGKNLKNFADGLISYGEAANNVAPYIEAMIAVADAIEPTVAISKDLHDNETILDYIFDHDALGDFGKNLKNFADGLKEFGIASNEVKGYTESMKAVAEATEPTVAISKDLHDNETALDYIFDHDALGDFGKNLKNFADGLVSFGTSADSVKGYIESMKSVADAIEPTVNLAKKIQENYQWYNYIVGEKSLENFGKNLANFGKGLSEYASSLEGVDFSIISSASTAIDSLIELGKNKEDGAKTKTLITNLKNAASEAKAFANNWKAVTGLDTAISNVEKVIALGDSISSDTSSNLTSFSDSLKSIAEAGIDAFTTTFSNAESDAEAAAVSFIEAAIDGVKDTIPDMSKELNTGIELTLFAAEDSYKGNFKDLGATLADELSKGLENEESTITSSGSKVCNSLIAIIKGFRSSFYSSGSYLGEGFAVGIESKIGRAKSAGSSLAKAASNALNATLDINSPSKVTDLAGKYFGLGFVNRLLDYVDIAYSASSEVGLGAIEGLNDAINGASDFGLDSLNGLTIRPVLDLTEIQNGTRQIYGMMNGIDGYAFDGSMTLAAKTQASMHGNGSDRSDSNTTFDKLTKAVEKLADKVTRPNQTNNFNVTGGDSDEIVEKLMKQIATEYDREDSEWE